MMPQVLGPSKKKLPPNSMVARENIWKLMSQAKQLFVLKQACQQPFFTPTWVGVRNMNILLWEPTNHEHRYEEMSCWSGWIEKQPSIQWVWPQAAVVCAGNPNSLLMTAANLDQPVGPQVQSLCMIPLMLCTELCTFAHSSVVSFNVSGCGQKVITLQAGSAISSWQVGHPQQCHHQLEVPDEGWKLLSSNGPREATDGKVDAGARHLANGEASCPRTAPGWVSAQWWPAWILHCWWQSCHNCVKSI